MAQRPQVLAKAFIKWNEAISITRPRGTSNHDHGELDATSSILELSYQSPNGSSTWRAAIGAYATMSGVATAVTAAVKVATPIGKRSMT